MRVVEAIQVVHTVFVWCMWISTDSSVEWQLVAVGHAGFSQPANAAIQTAIPGLASAGDALGVSQGNQLTPWLHLIFQVQPEPIWLPLAVWWHAPPWCQLAGAL